MTTAAVRESLAWLREVAPTVFTEHRDLQLDSRNLRRGDVFIGVPGAQSDGRRYLAAAAERGAAAALVDAEGWSAAPAPIPVRAVPGLRRVLGDLAADFYDRPSERLWSIGVTGTNGKTSCSQWIAQLLTRSGRRCAVIGTIGIGFPDAPFDANPLTTPDPVSLQREVRRLLDAGAQALAMEVSSIGLEQGRVQGMKYDVALFTNLTRDHLDYHGSMQRYEAAKALLFEWPTLTNAVVNIDDATGRRLVAGLVARGVPTTGYTLQGADAAGLAHRLSAEAIRATAEGLAFRAVLDGDAAEVAVPLVGQYNVENLLGVTGVSLACGIDFARAVAALPRLEPPPGRMQRVARADAADAPLAVVDYAHTPDALAQALQALRPLADARGGRLWAVFGAGGDRDPGKRAPMGAAAARHADVVVVTSDNPRTEDPAAIVAQVAAGAAGARELIAETDRRQAIVDAIGRASPADVVLIAGKGHEDYQIVGASRLPFSDVEQARAALAARGGR
jgi:UDP-N-acetylmuramyl-tripeptide synthetase